MKTISATLLVLLLAAGGWADDAIPPGHLRYIVVLRNPDAVPYPANRARPGKMRGPDLGKLGGHIEKEHGNVLTVTVPEAQGRKLREDPAILYVQRVWAGEPLDRFGASESNGSASESRLQPRTDAVETPGPAPNMYWQSGSYTYDPAGNITVIGSDLYRYDTVGRIVSATVRGQTETYGYDGFGNLVAKTTPGYQTVLPAVDGATNRLSGYETDVAGNLRAYGPSTYAYDGLNMLAETLTSLGQRKRFVYTADDERIGIQILNDGYARWKIRDFEGRVIREYETVADDPWRWVEDYMYAEGRLVAGDREQYLGGRVQFHTDHLGSTRMVTNASRLQLSAHEYYPFGQEQTFFGQEVANFAFMRPDPMKFTGHERDFFGDYVTDNTNYLDYMHEREYSPMLGRFLSVDPVLNLKRTLRQPQNWNRYAYVMNNPLRFTDPTGRDHYQEPGFTKPMTAENLDLTDAPPVIKAAFYAEGALLALGVVGFAAATAESGGLAAGAFRLAPVLRGNFIEKALATAFGGGLPRTFPTIDRFLNGVATSVKSIDLGASSYQSAARLTSVLSGYADKLSRFNGGAVGQVVVRGADITEKVLEVVVQRGVATPQQMEAIQAAAEYAKTIDVGLKVITIK